MAVTQDAHLSKLLAKQGIDPNNVELWHDYAPRSRGKEYSPYARFWRDPTSGKRVMEVGILPHIKVMGRKIECAWYYSDKQGKWYNRANLFSAVVDGRQVQLTISSDQPYGAKAGDRVTYSPQLFLDGAEVHPISDQPDWLETDPVNPAYHQNVLEWDYGICKRRIRLIEGRYRERWIFPTNPNGEVRIKHNQQGNFKLKLGKYKINDDEELVPTEAFIDPEPGYPFEVGATLTAYPDPHIEVATVDGYTQATEDASSWQTLHDHAGLYSSDTAADSYIYWQGCTTTADKWVRFFRSNYLFDTSPLPDIAILTGVVFSVCGTAKSMAGTYTPVANVYSSTPASNTALEAADFVKTRYGTTPFATGIAYADWNVAGYNNFTFEADGKAAISKTGITPLAIRDATYDVADNPPAWGSNNKFWIKGYFADQADTASDPKLVVTYYLPPAVGGGSVAIAGTLGWKFVQAVGSGSVTIASKLGWKSIKKKLRLHPYAYSSRKEEEGEQ